MMPRGITAKTVASVLVMLLLLSGTGDALADDIHQYAAEDAEEDVPPHSVLPGPLTYVLALVLLVIASKRDKIHRKNGGGGLFGR